MNIRIGHLAGYPVRESFHLLSEPMSTTTLLIESCASNLAGQQIWDDIPITKQLEPPTKPTIGYLNKHDGSSNNPDLTAWGCPAIPTR